MGKEAKSPQVPRTDGSEQQQLTHFRSSLTGRVDTGQPWLYLPEGTYLKVLSNTADGNAADRELHCPGLSMGLKESPW